MRGRSEANDMGSRTALGAVVENTTVGPAALTTVIRGDGMCLAEIVEADLFWDGLSPTHCCTSSWVDF